MRVDLLLDIASPRGRVVPDLVDFGFLLLWTGVPSCEAFRSCGDIRRFSEVDDSALRHPVWPVKLAMPAGVALARSRSAGNLYHAFHPWSGRMPGGLLIGTSGFAATLSAMTGSCAASTVTTGLVGMPAMEQRDHDRRVMPGTIGAPGMTSNRGGGTTMTTETDPKLSATASSRPPPEPRSRRRR